jgi:Glyoxalase-like domain
VRRIRVKIRRPDAQVAEPNRLALDHVFICCSEGGSEAEALARLGLKEGTANTHPGQGTACRRFFFGNAYLELLWVSDSQEAQGEAVRRTRLWERWSKRGGAACPFGIVLRPADDLVDAVPPFPTWPYRPPYLPPAMSIDVASETPLSGPEIFYLGFQRGRARSGPEPVEHGLPIASLTAVTVSRPASGDSEAARVLEAAGLVAFRDADDYLLELRFDEAIRGGADLRPALPLILEW